METPSRPEGPAWAIPPWLHARLVPDARFARAYDAIGDQHRALLKGLLADHYILTPPAPVGRTECAHQFHNGLAQRSAANPRPFVILLADSTLDAPALMLAALMPALTSGAAEVLVLRLGSRAAVPDVLLTACELAGQERVASLGPALAAQLLFECAQSGLPGLIVYPDSPDLRRVLRRQNLRERLDASCLRLAPLSLPRGLGVWRDLPTQFDPQRVAFLYGAHCVEAGGAKPGQRSRSLSDGSQFKAFASARRDLLLLPDARLGMEPAAARLTVAESRTGIWTWPELSPDVFLAATQSFASAPAPLS